MNRRLYYNSAHPIPKENSPHSTSNESVNPENDHIFFQSEHKMTSFYFHSRKKVTANSFDLNRLLNDLFSLL